MTDQCFWATMTWKSSLKSTPQSSCYRTKQGNSSLFSSLPCDWAPVLLQSQHGSRILSPFPYLAPQAWSCAPCYPTPAPLPLPPGLQAPFLHPPEWTKSSPSTMFPIADDILPLTSTEASMVLLLDASNHTWNTKRKQLLPWYWKKIFFFILWTIACQAPLLMGFPRQEDWNGLPFPSPGCWIFTKI